MKLEMYREAIESYSNAIKETLAVSTFSSLNLKRIRSLYPEYDGVPDEGLLRKVHTLFWPNEEYSVTAKRLIESEGDGNWINIYKSTYENRGEAYLRIGDFRRGVLDFKRIFNAVRNDGSAPERWRLVGTDADGEELYLDVRTAEFPNNNPARLWLKTVSNAPTHTVEAYEVDCKLRRINRTASVVYDANGRVLRGSDTSSGWQGIVPESMGERLYNGVCSVSR